jgi:hypothetical protein
MTEQQEQPQQKDKIRTEGKRVTININETDKVPVNDDIERGGAYVKTITAGTFEQDNVELSSLAGVLTTSANTDPGTS